MATLIIVNNKNKIVHVSRVSISNHYCNYLNDKLEICSKWLIFFSFHCLISFILKALELLSITLMCTWGKVTLRKSRKIMYYIVQCKVFLNNLFIENTFIFHCWGGGESIQKTSPFLKDGCGIYSNSLCGFQNEVGKYSDRSSGSLITGS